MKKILIIIMSIAAVTAFAQSRNALLIANGEYTTFSSLSNPVPEAETLAKSLIALGFDVKIVNNASKEMMQDALIEFEKKVSTNKGIAFFHYGGHAVQVKGENYLIPADADIPDEYRVALRAVNVSEVMASMKGDANIIILDSCRNNPLPEGNDRGGSQGLMSVKSHPRNSVIVYSAEADKTAADGVFTPVLSEKLSEDKEFIAVLRDVRNEVDRLTNGEQLPGQYDQLTTEIFLARDIPERLETVEADAERLERIQVALQMQLEKIEQEAKRKKNELQTVKEAEEQRSEQTKLREEQEQNLNDNQRRMEADFAKVIEQNNAKMKEIDKMRPLGGSTDELVTAANQIYAEIDKLASEFDTPMNESIEKTKTFYLQQKESIAKSKYETEDEFAKRKQIEEKNLYSQMMADINKTKNDFKRLIDDDKASVQINLKSTAAQTVIVRGSRVKLTFGELDIDHQNYPVIVTDTENPDIKGFLTLDVTSQNAADRQMKCQVIEGKIRDNKYEGEIEYGVIFDAENNKYISTLKGIRLIDITDGSEAASMENEQYRKAHPPKVHKPGSAAAQIAAANMPSINVNISNNNIINNNTAAAPTGMPQTIIIDISGNNITNGAVSAPQQPVQPSYTPTQQSNTPPPIQQQPQPEYSDYIPSQTITKHTRYKSSTSMDFLRYYFTKNIRGASALLSLGLTFSAIGSITMSTLYAVGKQVGSAEYMFLYFGLPIGAPFMLAGTILGPMCALPFCRAGKAAKLYKTSTGRAISFLQRTNIGGSYDWDKKEITLAMGMKL